MQNYFSQQRPYLKFQNSQLIEETFSAHLAGDTLKLEDIRHELSFRNRRVAQSLLKGINLLTS
tara:strand:+ start:534 stop:722 length:189 start_codon:yes stop_codon:yes gene_type:complete